MRIRLPLVAGILVCTPLLTAIWFTGKMRSKLSLLAGKHCIVLVGSSDITSLGKYCLLEDAIVSEGIEIQASDVSLDLRGLA